MHSYINPFYIVSVILFFRGIYEAWLVYLLVFISLAKCLTSYGRQLYNSWNQHIKRKNSTTFDFRHVLEELCDIHIMLIALLLRPHNSTVAAMTVVLQYCIVGRVLPWLHMRAWAVALVHIWMGQASFFAQVCLFSYYLLQVHITVSKRFGRS